MVVNPGWRLLMRNVIGTFCAEQLLGARDELASDVIVYNDFRLT